MSQPEKESTKTSGQRKSEYRDLLDRVEVLQETEEIGVETTLAVGDILTKANELFKDSNVKDRSTNTYEILLDARVIASTSDVLLSVTEGIDCTLDGYDPDNFAQMILSKFLLDGPEDREEEDDQEMNWPALFTVLRKTMRAPPKFTCLYGALGNPAAEPQIPKVRKARVVSKKQEHGQQREPEKITAVDKEEGSVDDIVKYVIHALNKEYEESGGEPVNYFQFVIDPTDFSTTIENMFHVSFLVRDGRVKIENGQNCTLVLIPTSPAEIKRTKKEGMPYKQSIMSLDVKTWAAAIERFQIKQNYLQKWKRG